MRVEVGRVEGAGYPTEVTYRFDEDLGAPDVRVVAWDGERFVDYVPPATGACGRLGR